MKESIASKQDWKNLLNDELCKTRANRQFASVAELLHTPEFNAFASLLDKRGRVISSTINEVVKLLLPSDFESIDERIGLALFANACFERHTGLGGTSIADNLNGQLKFLEIKGQLVSFVGEKIIGDDFNRKIYYLDIAGTLKITSGKGLGPILGKKALESEILRSKMDIVFLSRTQNPMLVGMARKILPDGIALAPFWCNPLPEIVESANWMVEKGFMARNNTRTDAHFDAKESMISWNSYGTRGDGTTWEDMTKQLKNLDWSRPEGVLMQKYLIDHGTNWTEAKAKGHSFVIGAFIKK